MTARKSEFIETPTHSGGNHAAGRTSISTSTGRTIDLLNPRPEDIAIEDIARGCSMTCRFTGQVTRFYSVAEHVVLVLDLLDHYYPHSPLSVRRYALLHDAQEAYIGNATSPLKRAMQEAGGNGYSIIEAKLEDAIRERFALSLVHDPEDAIKDCDLKARYCEGARIKPEEATWTAGVWRGKAYDPNMPVCISCRFGLAPNDAEDLFMRRVTELGIE